MYVTADSIPEYGTKKRIEYLKNLIFGGPCVLKDSKTLCGDSDLPVCWLDVFCDIANSYGIKFEVSLVERHCCFDPKEKKIIMIVGPRNKNPRIKYLLAFCHELAHAIQCLADGEHRFVRKGNVERAVAYEREAERLAYFIYKRYFFGYKKIHHGVFSGYRSCEEREFLKKWFGLA